MAVKIRLRRMGPVSYTHLPHAKSDNQILRVNMANIRRKLKENPAEPRYILTELGIGYRMLEDAE